MRWAAEIHVWPHSSGRGQVVDQKEAGDRVQHFECNADDIADALALAQTFAKGIETNPMVWRAPIMALARTERG